MTSSSSSLTKMTSVSAPTCWAHRLQSTGNVKPPYGTSQWVGAEFWTESVFCLKAAACRSRLHTTPCSGETCTRSLIAALSNFLLQQEEIIKAANVDVNGRYMMHNCPVNCLVAAEALPGSGTGVFIRMILCCSSRLFFFNLVHCHIRVYEVEKSKCHRH